MNITKRIRLYITNNPALYDFLSKTWRFLNRGIFALIQYRMIFLNYDKRAEKEGCTPLFTDIEIETLNICNGECSFCPVNKHIDPRHHVKMEDELFKKIINELEDLDFSGNVFLYSNNEPFLDKRIFEFMKYASEHLKRAKIIIYTNGTVLDLEGFKKAVTYLDELYVDNYSDARKWHNNIEEIRRYYYAHINDTKCTVTFSMRRQNEVLTTRGGDAPNKKNKLQKLPCDATHCQMVIRSSGEVSLCCNDPLGKFTMGDVHDDSLIRIWNNDKYQRIRGLLRKSRANIEKCKYCDCISTTK